MSEWITSGEDGTIVRDKLNSLHDLVYDISGATLGSTSGTSGKSGTSGRSGTSGNNGTSGITGSSGTAGTSGWNVTGVDYFFTNNLDTNLSTYYQLTRYSSDPIERVDSVLVSGSTSDLYFIDSNITALDDPSLNYIPPGVWKLHSYSYIDTGNTSSDNFIISKIYIITTGGTETQIASITSSNIQSADPLNPVESEVEYYTNVGSNMNITDRIVIKMFASSTYSGRILYQVHSDSIHATHVSTPITVGSRGNDGSSGTSGTSGPYFGTSGFYMVDLIDNFTYRITLSGGAFVKTKII